MYKFLYDILPRMKFITPGYHVTLGLIVILVILAIRRYLNFTKMYAKLPTYPFMFQLIYDFFFKPKNIPFYRYCFQKIIAEVKTFQNQGICFGWIPYPVLFVFGEESVKIFSNEQAAVDKPFYYKLVTDVFGTGLITRNGYNWRRIRKLLNPVFRVTMVKDKMPIFNEKAESLVRSLSEIEDKRAVDVHQYLKYCSFAILSESIIGLKDEEKNKKFIKRFAELIENMFGMTVYRFIFPWMHWNFMLNFFSFGRQYLKMSKELKSLTKKLVSDIKDAFASTGSTDMYSAGDNAICRNSFVHTLMELHLADPSFTLEDIRSEIITFVIGGYDTVSHTMTWCLFLLGHHPEIQEQVYDEVMSISANHVSYGDIYRLKYLECVIKETLRLYPAIPLRARQTSKDIQCGKYLVPGGTTIAFVSYLLHRDPNVYPDPDKFDPERFLDENLEKRPWTYTPFSEGVRSCIGKKFAMIEMIVMLTHIVRNFKITSIDRIEDINLRWNLTLTTEKPLHMQLEPRM